MNGHWKLRPSLLFLGALILAHGSYSANAAEYDESEKPAVESILEDKKGLEDTSLMEEPKEVKEAKPEEIEEAKPAEVEEAKPEEVEEAKSEEKPVPGEITPVPEVVTEPEPVTKKTIPTKEEVKPSGFIHDARLVLKPRSVYLDRKTVDGDDRESFAAGGSLLFISGKWKDTFSVSAEVFTSQKIYGDVDRDGAKLLREGQQGLTVLGNAYGQIDYKDVRVRLGRQEFNLPYVNRNYSRMVPNTFEAVAINLDRKKFDMLVGYINKMKKRDSGAFVSMSEAAGVPGPSDEGTAVLGARYTFSERLVFGALDFYTFDVFNIFYAEADYTLPLSETNRLKLSAQFTDERSVGDELLDAPPFQTQVWSVQVSAGFHNAIIRAAFSSTSAEARVRNPFGGYPGFISLMKSNFNRAGEQAWMLGLSYDLSRLGLKGVSMITKFASGFGAEDEAQRPDQQEFDITFDYYPPEGRLFSGFWLRVRGAVQFQDGKEDAYDLRVLLNYSYNIK